MDVWQIILTSGTEAGFNGRLEKLFIEPVY